MLDELRAFNVSRRKMEQVLMRCRIKYKQNPKELTTEKLLKEFCASFEVEVDSPEAQDIKEKLKAEGLWEDIPNMQKYAAYYNKKRKGDVGGAKKER